MAVWQPPKTQQTISHRLLVLIRPHPYVLRQRWMPPYFPLVMAWTRVYHHTSHPCTQFPSIFREECWAKLMGNAFRCPIIRWMFGKLTQVLIPTACRLWTALLFVTRVAAGGQIAMPLLARTAPTGLTQQCLLPMALPDTSISL